MCLFDESVGFALSTGRLRECAIASANAVPRCNLRSPKAPWLTIVLWAVNSWVITIASKRWPVMKFEGHCTKSRQMTPNCSWTPQQVEPSAQNLTVPPLVAPPQMDILHQKDHSSMPILDDPQTSWKFQWQHWTSRYRVRRLRLLTYCPIDTTRKLQQILDRHYSSQYIGQEKSRTLSHRCFLVDQLKQVGLAFDVSLMPTC